MKNILKICVIAVLTLSMLLCIVACGDKDGDKDPATTTAKKPATTTAKPATTTAGGGDDDVTEAPVTTDAPDVEIGTDGNEFGGWNPIA